MIMNPLIYRRRFLEVPVVEQYELPEEENPIVPDQSPNNKIFYDSHGMVLSDIALLFKAVESQNNELVQSLSAKFSQHNDSSYLDSNMTEQQMFDSTESRYAQTPTEVYNQAGYIASALGSDDVPQSSESSDGNKIQFDGNETPSSES